MAETQLRFGDQSSADVKLFLTGPNEEKYSRNPIYLHSQILKRSKSLQPVLSEPLSSDKSTEIWETITHDFDHFIKCIQLMYGEIVNFSSIEECLAILSVASEMLVDDGINKCMEYLEAVRWSAEEETQIRKVLSSLELKLLPDLAARLYQEDENHIIFVEKSIQEIVSLLIKGGDNNLSSQNTVELYLVRMLEGNMYRDVMDECGRVFLQEFKSAMDSRDISSLFSLFQLIQHCDGEILKAAMKTFCEDVQFIEFVKQQKDYHTNMFGIINPNLFEILMGFMKATGDGKVIISRACRVEFLSTWVPIMGRLCRDASRGKLGEFDKAVLDVVESLPPVDKKTICLVWAKVYRLNRINFATPFLLCLKMCSMPNYESVAK